VVPGIPPGCIQNVHGVFEKPYQIGHFLLLSPMDCLLLIHMVHSSRDALHTWIMGQAVTGVNKDDDAAINDNNNRNLPPK